MSVSQHLGQLRVPGVCVYVKQGVSVHTYVCICASHRSGQASEFFVTETKSSC